MRADDKLLLLFAAFMTVVLVADWLLGWPLG